MFPFLVYFVCSLLKHRHLLFPSICVLLLNNQHSINWSYFLEFREIRASFDFFTCCTTPSLAAKITLQPLERYGSLLDCGIIFSDILVIPQALGLEVQMLPNVGPHFPSPLSGPDDLSRLHKKVDVQASLGYVFEAIRETKRSITVPLIGFCGAPWTLMAYMIEGIWGVTISFC